MKLLFETGRNELFGKVSALNWKRSLILPLTTLYVILVLFRRTAWSNDKMFSLDLALSKSVYSASSITLQARL